MKKIQVNKANVFTASLESTIKNIEDKIKSATFQVYQGEHLVYEAKPKQNGSEYEVIYAFPEIGKYDTFWKFDFGGVNSVKRASIEVIPDVEISSEILSHQYSANQKTACQLMAELAICNHTEHYHGAVNLKDGKDKIQFLDNYKGRKGFFLKKFLINDKFNLNNWRVTWDAMQKDIYDFVGKPVVLTPDKDHPPVDIQEDYRVGVIIDVGLDEINHSAWQVSEIFDKKAQQMIIAEEIEFGSPTVLIRSPDTREQKSKGTQFQQDILHRFRPAHDALVGNPAYGKEIDNIPAVCTGDGPACALKLLEVSASVQFKDNMMKFDEEYFANIDFNYYEAAFENLSCKQKYATIKDGTVKVEWNSAQHRYLHFKKHPHSHVCVTGDGKHHTERSETGSKEGEINSDNTNQLTIVPFVRKVLKQRFSASELANIVDNIQKSADGRPPKAWFDRCVKGVMESGGARDPEAVCNSLWHEKHGATDSCVSKKIKIIADENPSMAHDQVIAIAYSYCRGDSKEAELENVFIAELAENILPHLKPKSEDFVKLQTAVFNLEQELKAANGKG